MTLLLDNDTEFIIDDKLSNIIQDVINCVLEIENIPKNVEISLSIVSNEEIKELNKEYRNKNVPTDVLSFPMLEFTDEMCNYEEVINPETGDYMLGDIIISYEQAQIQAEKYGHSIYREVGFLIAHSMFHLLGYDHTTEKEENIMFSKQNIVMDKVGLKR